MASSSTDWATLRDQAIPIVREAGTRIRGYMGKLATREKGRQDYVTALDEQVEHYLHDALGKAFPNHQVVGEESFKALEHIAGLIWVVDPLDGTSNMVFGLPFRAVSLALLADGHPVAALVCDPDHDELFDAARGAGARCNGETLRLTGEGDLPVGASSGFIAWCQSPCQGSALAELVARFGKLRIMGSQALQLCYVAAGRFCANVSREARLWDDAAGALIIEEAGGWYGDFHGHAIFPVATDSAAARGEELHSLAAAPQVRAAITTILSKGK